MAGVFLYSAAAGNPVTHSDWVDLTATITAAVAGGLDSDLGALDLGVSE